MELTWADVCGRRLARHGLTTALHSAAGAAAAMCGAHAQVLPAAEVSIGLRAPGLTRAGVRDALWSDHSLIKTFGPRGTIHLLPAAELASWCGALSAVPSAARRPPAMRLTDEQTDELVAAIGAILAGAELTVDEVTEALADRVGPWAVEPVMPAFQTMWPRWRQMTEIAAHRGVLCFGPNRGRKVTYTSPVRWLAGPAADPTGWLLRRYLHSYGPATPQHFARWLATTPAWARSVFEAHDLTEVSFAGTRAWVAAGDTDAGDPPDGVLLLPHFDAFAVGSQPRELLFPGAAWDRALAGSQAGNFPVLLIDGMVAGVWHQKRSGRYVDVTVEPVVELSPARRRDLAAETERIGAFSGLIPRLTVGTVTVGPHA
jgi:hypothetical protein